MSHQPDCMCEECSNTPIKPPRPLVGEIEAREVDRIAIEEGRWCVNTIDQCVRDCRALLVMLGQRETEIAILRSALQMPIAQHPTMARVIKHHRAALVDANLRMAAMAIVWREA